MAIEVPPDVDTTHPVMDITGPGVAGKTLEATGAHTATWTGGGGGGSGTITGHYTHGGGGIPEETPRAVVGLTLVTLTVNRKKAVNELLKIELSGGRVIIDQQIGEDLSEGTFSMSFLVSPGESWKYSGNFSTFFTEFELEII